MASRGVLFALTNEQAEHFLAASSDEQLDELVEAVEEAWEETYLAETDKAWDAIHRCLSDGTNNFDGGTYPLNRCILGGKQLYEEDSYIIAFVTADEVRDVAAALLGVTEAWFRQQFAGLVNTDYPQEELQGVNYEETFQYSWEYLKGVMDFYQRAAQAHRAVIFTLDQ